MTLTRRRFLTITAAALATPVSAAPLRWQGRALGADCTLEIHAPRDAAERALRDTRAILRAIEAQFSLYDPTSALARLNAGETVTPSPEMTEILSLCDTVHHATNGTFDPTVQVLWEAISNGESPDSALPHTGWTRIQRRPLKLTTGQKLTLNGIAQGYATDLVKQSLAKAGLTKSLVNIGEYAALGGPFRIGMASPTGAIIDTATLTNTAIATSSPNATTIGTQPHILSTTGRTPQWHTASVQGPTAALADAASTAFCLMTKQEIATAMAALNLHSATLQDATGTIHRL